MTTQGEGVSHPKATLSGALGVFAGLLTLGRAVFGYNLPVTTWNLGRQSTEPDAG